MMLNTVNNEIVVKGSVLQLSPETCKNPMFGGCFMVADKVKDWGIQGYVQSLGSEGKRGGLAYYRASWEEVEYVGKAVWVTE